jgi:DNA-binding transcriptional LysR family regulator
LISETLYHRLSRIDLNLLVAMHVLLQECNVTRASKRLCITPSAMSKTLSRLRDVLGDELFIRAPTGLVPTARAKELRGPLSKILADMDRLVFPDEFDPGCAAGIITLGISEPASVLIMGALLGELKETAPGLTLVTHNVLDGYLQELETGKLDFCIYPESNCGVLTSKLVGGVQLSAMMRKDHPLAEPENWNKAAFLEAPKIIYTSPDVDHHWLTQYSDELRRQGSRGIPHFETSQLVTAINILLATDYLMVTARGLADSAVCRGRVTEQPIPEVFPFNVNKMNLYLIYHPRNETSPLMGWLADKITSVVNRVMPPHRG